MNNVDIIKLLTNGINFPRLFQDRDKLYAAYMNLSTEESTKLAKWVLETQNKRTQWAILRNLAVYYPNSLNMYLDSILYKEIEDVGIAFKNAGDEICEDVIRRIEKASSEKIKFELLTILAWIGTEKAQVKLSEFISTPIIYRKSQLYADYFTKYAGWEFDNLGERRDLFISERFPLYTKDIDTPKLTGETCPWCKRSLLLSYDIETLGYYLPAFKNDQKPFQIMTCSHCIHFATLYSETSSSRGCSWSIHNTRPSHMKNTDGGYGEFQEFTPQTIIEKERNNPYTYMSWLPKPRRQNGSIGGFPGWVYSHEYPTCPSCNKSMIYIAQYDISWVVYAFRCFGCEINATNIQTD